MIIINKSRYLYKKKKRQGQRDDALRPVCVLIGVGGVGAKDANDATGQ